MLTDPSGSGSRASPPVTHDQEGSPPTTCEGRGHQIPVQIINTLSVFALVVLSFALIVAVPVLYASSEDVGRSNRLILIGGLAWVGLVLLNWGMSYFVV
jgi:photosystem II PsbZ protein